MVKETSSFFVRMNSDIVFDGSFYSVKDYTFGAIEGFSYGVIIDNFFKESSTNKVIYVGTWKDLINDIVNGKTDVIVSDRFFMHSYARRNKTPVLKELLPNIEDTPSYLVFSKYGHSDNRLVLRIFNVVLDELKKDGTYDKLLMAFPK